MHNTKPKQVTEFEKQCIRKQVGKLLEEIDHASNNLEATKIVIESEVFEKLSEWKQQEIIKYKEQRHPIKGEQASDNPKNYKWVVINGIIAIAGFILMLAGFVMIDLVDVWTFWFGE